MILDPPETPETARSGAAEAKPRPAHAFRIGGVEIDSPFVLAPLAGVSDSPFRQLAREQGASAVYTEMVSSDGLVRGSRNTLDYCAFEAMERPIGIQVFGSDPGIMADAARVLNDMPAGQRPDLIDINMGCPVRKVVNRCAGAALLQDVPRIAAIVERMSAATPLPVTAKIRLGWDGNSRNVVEVARTLEAAGARAVAIHARTRAEKFEGQAHWDMIAEAKRAVSIPVIGNGDVRSAEDAVRMLEQTGCDGVMLGRAAFGDPWVFRRIRALVERGEALPPPTAAERLEAGVRHLAMMETAVGPEHAAREMRKHVAWYIKGLPHSARVREQVNHTRTAREMAELLRAYLGDLAALGLEAFAPVDPPGYPPKAGQAPEESLGATG
ncbi:MAG TPA: tRNA dihydrouridine synthase DusB [Methylomirabilota bacterium]|nr:tRNA dihydrouridine synthase DusB [Methylomirabilota bacterium]